MMPLAGRERAIGNIAHLDRALVVGDVQAQFAILQEKRPAGGFRLSVKTRQQRAVRLLLDAHEQRETFRALAQPRHRRAEHEIEVVEFRRRAKGAFDSRRGGARGFDEGTFEPYVAIGRGPVQGFRRCEPGSELGVRRFAARLEFALQPCNLRL